MSNCCCCVTHPDVDKGAALKAFWVFFYCLFMTCYFLSYESSCSQQEDEPTVWGKSHYDFWRQCDAKSDLIPCNDKAAVATMAYFSCYMVMTIVSLLGSVLLFLGCAGWNKVYGGIVFFCWAWLSAQDWWSVGAMMTYFSGLVDDESASTDSLLGNYRNEYAFRIITIWLAETYIFLNAAYDAFDRTDKRQEELNEAIPLDENPKEGYEAI